MTAILTLTEVALYFRNSKPTIKRWLFLTRQGLGDFPLPISSKGCRLLWNKEDIVTWRSRLGNEAPLLNQLPETPTERRRRSEKVAKGLNKLGITVQKKGE